MSAAVELIEAVRANCGHIRVEGGWLVISPEDAAASVMVGLSRHKAEIISLLEKASIPPHDPAEWREPFDRWLEFACVRDPRCLGGVRCLHIAFCEWAIGQEDVPCTRNTFERMLEELGFVMADGLVSGLILRADMEFYRNHRVG